MRACRFIHACKRTTASPLDGALNGLHGTFLKGEAKILHTAAWAACAGWTCPGNPTESVGKEGGMDGTKRELPAEVAAAETLHDLST